MYRHIVLGGTFDHFHVGHAQLLEMAFDLGQKVTLGLTVDGFSRLKACAHALQSFETRYQKLYSFAAGLHRENDLNLIPISDVFGCTLTDRSLAAIVVTQHSQGGAKLINQKRIELGLAPLAVHICPFVLDAVGQVVSSTRVRSKNINDQGDVLISHDAAMNLRQPLGDVYAQLPALDVSKQSVVLIGDVVTRNAITLKQGFTCAYIDHLSRRKPYLFDIPSPYQEVVTGLQNPKAQITVACASHLRQNWHVHKNTVFSICGEEDLLAVPAILQMPSGGFVIYGQPFENQGVVVVKVDEKKKVFLSKLLLQSASASSYETTQPV